MKKTLRLCLGLVIAITGAQFSHAKSSKWERIKAANGILVDRRDTGKDVLEFRGRGMVNAPILHIMSALSDPKSRKKWLEGALEIEILKRLSTTEYIFYYAQKAPWPLQDRDYIAKSTFYADETNKWVHITVKSLQNYKGGPKRSRVRMPYLFAKWSLKPKDKGKKTWVEFYVQADPGGVVPSWAANMVSKDIPYKTIRKLRKFLKTGKANKEFIEKYKKYEDWH